MANFVEANLIPSSKSMVKNFVYAFVDVGIMLASAKFTFVPCFRC
jgi:hypothetical protein